MRPPGLRNTVGIATQIRPRFGTELHFRSAPPTFVNNTLNNDSFFKQACIQGHERQTMPLNDANRLRNPLRIGNFGHEASAPKLHKRPKRFVPVEVTTWTY
jgi:hypothetical protein